MLEINRREALGAIWHSILILMLSPSFSKASDRFKVDHPLMPPSKEFSGQCPVCGMLRSMWARTWISFKKTDGVSEVCSFHCLADFTLKSGELPSNIELAEYHAPKTMIASPSAVIVIGSSAKGTMSPKSKLVFSTVKDAEEFISGFGGKRSSFEAALDLARAGVVKKNAMLVKKRLKKGKIKDPAADDRCAVCEMYPFKYPKNKCQIHTKDRKIYHFCSTQCMFAFLTNPAEYGTPGAEPLLVWVTDYTSGNWVGGRSAYYVLGANDELGPMGFEAFPFNLKSDAKSFSAESGGKILLFEDVTIEKILKK